MSSKKFAVFDIDGTFFRWQLFSEVVLELINRGQLSKENGHAIDVKMSDWRQRKSRYAFREYELAVVKALFSGLSKIKVIDIEAAADTVLEKSGQHVYAYTRDLSQTLKSRGYTLIAISGSQKEIVERFAKLWNFDISVGQGHEVKNGVYTGAIPDKLLIHQKGEILKDIIKKYDLSYKDSYAVGDSKTDAPMLDLVDHPIAFNPDDALFEVAKEKGWKIALERKNMIYELEQRDGTYLLAQAKPR